MQPIHLDYKPYGNSNNYHAWFYNKFPKNLPVEINIKGSKLLIVYDNILPTNFIKEIKRLLSPLYKNIEIYGITYGSKSLIKLEEIWKKMVDFIPDTIVGIGGGTISDLVGFAAGTYQRGITNIIFSTTTLGMVDASLGGKTAIDFHNVKNSIGVIKYPIHVVNILEILKTLPREEFISGLAESVKGAVLFDKVYFQQLDNYSKINNHFEINDVLCNLIAHSAKLKMINSEQPLKHKLKLLYGHAISSAIEIISNKHIRHGDAVSIGMTVEGAMSCILGYWNIQEWRKQTQLLQQLTLPIKVDINFNIEKICNRMSLYKKLVKENSYGFIFPKNIGQVVSQKDGFVTYLPILKTKKLIHNALQLINQELDNTK